MVLDSFTKACSVLTQNTERIALLAKALACCTTTEEKEAVLDQDSEVCSRWDLQYQHMPSSWRVALKALMAIGQADHILCSDDLSTEHYRQRLQELIDCLHTVENFYHDLGGIVGYHLIMTRLLCEPLQTAFDERATFLAPPMIPINVMSEAVTESIYHCIKNLPHTAEIYPVGGAADRLNLKDPITMVSLPAASLYFCGMTLLERLIVDVQAKEYLYFKLFGQQVTVPIAMMTSEEKDNDRRIKALCQQHGYFGRSSQSFFFFCQPLVPTISSEGVWALRGPLRPLLRPGGHGVIWKLARDSGCFSWLKELGVTKALIRQINNPIAGVDYGLFSFTGYGWMLDKAIGFSSCPRAVGSAEGTNVLVKQKKGSDVHFTLTNIEYCDMQKFGIADEPIADGSPYSKYPSNTNILFVDIQKIEDALEDRPIPGMLVNLKNITYTADDGSEKQKTLARLESMMQNISDSFITVQKETVLPAPEQIPSYITFNERRKTISATKKELQAGGSLMETPEGCLLDMMHNAQELLLLCGFTLTSSSSSMGPIFIYHPALGPLYSIIAQKLRSGRISSSSVMHLGIAEADIEGLDLDGALLIEASSPVGALTALQTLLYSDDVGRCHMKHVTIVNKGKEDSSHEKLWKHIHYKECCHIEIEGDGELFAEDVVIQGDVHIKVPSGMVAYLFNEGDDLIIRMQKKLRPTWYWAMRFDESKNIVLEKK